MKIHCKKHGEVEAEPNQNGDVYCPECVKEYIARATWEHVDKPVSMGCKVPNTRCSTCGEPNIQNIPIRTEDGRKIREAFRDGALDISMSADFESAERRMASYVDIGHTGFQAPEYTEDSFKSAAKLREELGLEDPEVKRRRERDKRAEEIRDELCGDDDTKRHLLNKHGVLGDVPRRLAESEQEMKRKLMADFGISPELLKPDAPGSKAVGANMVNHPRICRHCHDPIDRCECDEETKRLPPCDLCRGADPNCPRCGGNSRKTVVPHDLLRELVSYFVNSGQDHSRSDDEIREVASELASELPKDGDGCVLTRGAFMKMVDEELKR